ncbi:hypothetical protein PSE_4120 [Pseudovibrio sp. FO-BEG1]|nr:hypothetical protein PSE_4120 [Pseudovibrio sp. FO-BEG1]
MVIARYTSAGKQNYYDVVFWVNLAIWRKDNVLFSGLQV